MGLKRIEVVSIPVKDQDAALKFYTDKLGFRVTMDEPYEKDKRWIQLAPPETEDTTISLMPAQENAVPGATQGLVLLTDNIEADYTSLKEAGVDVTPPQETPWGKFSNLHDPDGNGIMLREAA